MIKVVKSNLHFNISFFKVILVDRDGIFGSHVFLQHVNFDLRTMFLSASKYESIRGTITRYTNRTTLWMHLRCSSVVFLASLGLTI